MDREKKTKILFFSIVGIVVVSSIVIPVSVNSYYQNQQDKMQKLSMIIVDLNISDSFSGSIWYDFKIRSNAQFGYQEYPASLNPRGTYIYDNLTAFVVYGEQLVNESYYIVLITKMVGKNSMKLITPITVETNKIILQSINYPKLGGTIELSYYLIPFQL